MSLLDRINKHPLTKAIVKLLKRVSLPGFHGMSLYHVGMFFFRSLFDEDLLLRASSLAFSFFLALFPAIIFFFTLIAYIPIDSFQEDLLGQIVILLPSGAYDLLITTIEDIITQQNLSLLSFGFIFAIVFASNAFTSLMTAFNKYVANPLKRPWYVDRYRSIGLTFLVTFILVCTIVIITYLTITINWMADKQFFNKRLITIGLQAAEYGSMFILIYFVFSSLYFFGSPKDAKWHFFSAGSSLATFLSVFATAGFTSYVNNFDSYNKLYGSIGTILVIMVLIYFNCIVLLVGFELNASIDRAERFHMLRKNTDVG